MRGRSGWLVFALGLLSSGTPAQVAAQGWVVGRVVDERGAGLVAARVLVEGRDRHAVAGIGGRFVISDVRTGRTVLVASYIGHAPAGIEVVVTAGDTAHVVIALRPAPVSLGGVQVTATPSRRDPLDVAQSTSRLEGHELERSRGSTLGAMLAGMPGIAERWDGPAASAPIIRGLSGDRVLVLQDGHRVGDLASTAPDHAVTVDPAAAASVEVVRGPAALLHGSSAIGGVVHVISGDIPLTRPERLHGSAALSGESASRGGSGHVELAGPAGGAGAYRVRLGARRHGDVQAGRGWEASHLPNTAMRSIDGVLGAALSATRVSGGAAYRAYGFEYGIPVPPSQLAGAITLRGFRHEMLASLDARDAGRLSGARVESSAQWYTHDESDVDGRVGTALALRSQQFRATAPTGGLGPLLEGAVGVSLRARQNDVAGPGALLPPNESFGAGVFIFQEVALPFAGMRGGAPRLPVGLRVDRHVVRSDGHPVFGASRTRTFAGVSGSVGLSLPLASRASLAMHLARAVRPPTSEELFSQAGHAGTGAFEIGDPDLRVEVSTGADVVLRLESSRTALQLSGYANRFAGYIALAPTGRDTVVRDGTGATRSYPLHVVGQADVRLAGMEFALHRVLSRRLVAGVMGDLVYARDRDGEPLPFMPAPRAGASLEWQRGPFSAGLSVRHALQQPPVPAGEFRSPASTLVNAHAGLRVVRASQVHALTLRIDNAGDALHREATSRIKEFAPNPGRSIVVLYRVSL